MMVEMGDINRIMQVLANATNVIAEARYCNCPSARRQHRRSTYYGSESAAKRRLLFEASTH